MERGVEVGTEEKPSGMSKTGKEPSGTRKAGRAWTEEWDGLNRHQKIKSTVTTHTKLTPKERKTDRQNWDQVERSRSKGK